MDRINPNAPPKRRKSKIEFNGAFSRLDLMMGTETQLSG